MLKCKYINLMIKHIRSNFLIINIDAYTSYTITDINKYNKL